MNALNQAIKTVTDVTLANAAITEAKGWGDNMTTTEMVAVWEANKKAQTVSVVSPCGATVEVIGVFATGNMLSHCRLSYKLNGKRAKAADVEAMFKAEPVVATAARRRALGKLVGM